MDINSNKIKVYPSAYRDSSKDPESRLYTEANITRPLQILCTHTDYPGSFVITKTYSTSSDFEFVIGGYYFKLDKSILSDLFSDSTKTYYAYIVLEDIDVSDTTETNIYSKRLSNNLENNESLDIEGVFKGLIIATEDPDDFNFKLCLLKNNIIPEDSRVKFKLSESDLNIESTERLFKVETSNIKINKDTSNILEVKIPNTENKDISLKYENSDSNTGKLTLNNTDLKINNSGKIEVDNLIPTSASTIANIGNNENYYDNAYINNIKNNFLESDTADFSKANIKTLTLKTSNTSATNKVVFSHYPTMEGTEGLYIYHQMDETSRSFKLGDEIYTDASIIPETYNQTLGDESNYFNEGFIKNINSNQINVSNLYINNVLLSNNSNTLYINNTAISNESLRINSIGSSGSVGIGSTKLLYKGYTVSRDTGSRSKNLVLENLGEGIQIGHKNSPKMHLGGYNLKELEKQLVLPLGYRWCGDKSTSSKKKECIYNNETYYSAYKEDDIWCKIWTKKSYVKTIYDRFPNSIFAFTSPYTHNINSEILNEYETKTVYFDYYWIQDTYNCVDITLENILENNWYDQLDEESINVTDRNLVPIININDDSKGRWYSNFSVQLRRDVTLEVNNIIPSKDYEGDISDSKPKNIGSSSNPFTSIYGENIYGTLTNTTYSTRLINIGENIQYEFTPGVYIISLKDKNYTSVSYTTMLQKNVGDEWSYSNAWVPLNVPSSITNFMVKASSNYLYLEGDSIDTVTDSDGYITEVKTEKLSLNFSNYFSDIKIYKLVNM